MLRAVMPLFRAVAIAGALLIIMASQNACSRESAPPPVPAINPGAAVTQAAFGTLPDGSAVEIFTLTNAHGVEARISNYGGIVVSLKVPDRSGQLDDVVLGYDTAAEYATNKPTYFGAIIGRYANRIGGARFTLDGKTVQLTANDGANQLHGGVKGFDRMLWKGEPAQDGRARVMFSYTSPAGEEGFPGTLTAHVTYTLTDSNELAVDYHATTDAPTVVNLSHHSYFNLAGQGARDILDHELQIQADRYTPVDDTLIPTGELATVDATPFDFRTSTRIGARIGEDNDQLRLGRGYDHNFVLSRTGAGLQHAARVVERSTGRTMTVATTEPGLQFYTGNFLDGTITGKQGRVYRQRFAFCLETQHFPDSPNKPQFPSTVLRPGQEYTSRTVYTFGTEE